MKYLIKDTTREEREAIVKNGLALASIEGLGENDGTWNDYIEGIRELKEIYLDEMMKHDHSCLKTTSLDLWIKENGKDYS